MAVAEQVFRGFCEKQGAYMSYAKRSPERVAACKESAKKLYRERREWGVCITCGKPRLNGETTKSCVKCKEAKAEYRKQNRQHIRETTKERMDRYRAAGLCIYCGKPTVPGLRLCTYHREYYIKADRKYRMAKGDVTIDGIQK